VIFTGSSLCIQKFWCEVGDKNVLGFHEVFFPACDCVWLHTCRTFGYVDLVDGVFFSRFLVRPEFSFSPGLAFFFELVG